MFMEAVLMSLKDLEMRHPEAEEQLTSVTPESLGSSHKDDLTDCATTDDGKPSKTDTSSISVENLKPIKMHPTSTSLINSCDLAPQHPSPDTSVSSVGDVFDTPPSSIESGSTGTSTRTDTSASIQSSLDADVSGNTKATVTVVRNPTGHIMDGLMRRWDLNFFRNR